MEDYQSSAGATTNFYFKISEKCRAINLEMASESATISSEEDIPKQSRSSMVFPPNLSDLRIWLLGENWEDKCSVGNLLLGRNAFHTEAHHSLLQCVKTERGQIEDQNISVTITPNLLDQKTPDVQKSQALSHCVELSAPGPHVLLLILRPDTFTEKNRDRITRNMKCWSDHTLEHTVVLLMEEPKTSSGAHSSTKESEIVYSLLQDKQRYHILKRISTDDQSSVTELFEKIKTLEKENNSFYLSLDIYESPPEVPSTRKKIKDKFSAYSPAQTLNLVLFGRSSAGKISTANTILNQTESKTETIHTCVKREGEICGRAVMFIEMPELYNTALSRIDVMNETYRALSLCSFNIHAFLMVIPVGSLTKDDKGELKTISEIFDTTEGKFWDYLMILFIYEGNRQDRADTDFIDVTRDIQKVFKKCGNNCHILSVNTRRDSEQVSELLQKIDAMIANNSYTSYSCDMYVEAQLRNRFHLESRIEEMEKEIRELKEIKKTAVSEINNTNKGCLRMVLVGKTGNGKSATGNTILNREAFKSQTSFNSVTLSCQKEEGFINGVPVTVVDTPGLFDTQLLTDEVKNEILKCFSLLSPGPHVFLLVLKVGRYTKEEMETLNLIKETFGTNAGMFSIVIFTHGDELEGKPIESHLKGADSQMKKLIRDCGGRYHVIDNKNKANSKQVSELLDKISRMIGINGGGFYTNEMFKEAEVAIQQEVIRILQEKKEEIERENKCLREKYEEEMAEMKKRTEEQRELMERERKAKEEEFRIKAMFLQKELQRRVEQEEKEKKYRKAAEEQRRIEEEKQQIEWKRKWQEIQEQQIKLQKEQQNRDQEYREKYEREKREMEERHKERLKEEQEEYKKRLKEERSEWEMIQKKMIDEFEQEKKQREEAENERLQQYSKERERIEKKFEKSKTEMRKQKEEWEKSWNEEWDDRVKEEEKRRKEERAKLKKLQETFEREREDEEAKKKREDKARREQEQERKQMEKEHERKLTYMKSKCEDEARKQAEEFNEFRVKYKKDFHALHIKHALSIQKLMLQHEREMQELNLKHEKESHELEKEYSTLKELSKQQQQNLHDRMNKMKEEHQREVARLERRYEEKCVLL